MAKLAKVWNGSAWVPIASSSTDLSAYQTVARNGLTSVVPTSVSVGSGSATVGTNGAITVGSGVSSITINGAFSSTYESYKIIYNSTSSSGTPASGGDIALQLSGITSGYYNALFYTNFSSGGNNMVVNGNQSSWIWAGGNSPSGAQLSIDIHNPFSSKAKYGRADYVNQLAAGNTGMSEVYVNSSASATGFTLTPSSSATITGGTIRIYGYNNN